MSRNKPKKSSNANEKFYVNFSFAIVASRYNEDYVDRLISRVRAGLIEKNVSDSKISIIRVPGANEIPYTASLLAQTGDYDCIVALGVVIKGDTPHHEIIAHSTANALHKIAIDTQIPIINGIIVTNTEDQAKERVFGELDRGSEYAESAFTMARIGKDLNEKLDEIERNEELFGGFDFDDDDDDDDGFNPFGGNSYHKN